MPRHFKSKKGPLALPFFREKSCPNFQKVYASTIKKKFHFVRFVKPYPNFQKACASIVNYFFHLIRSWKIVLQFFHLTMVL